MKKFGSLMLLYVFCSTNVFTQECRFPLGMEDGSIKDSQIKTIDYTEEAYGWQARLNKNISQVGAWCVDSKRGTIDGTNYDQHIMIDLLNLTKITGIATQGGQYNGRNEWVKNYKLSYTRDGRVWYFYGEKDNPEKIFRGNTDRSSVVRHNLNHTILARYIRVHPGVYTSRPVCMRLELYGCIPAEKKVILSYSMSVGQSTLDGKVHYKDTSYAGLFSKNFRRDGTGILTDGKFGPVNSNELNGKGWVGWSRDVSKSQYVDISFEFSGVRRFKDVSLTTNVDKQRNHAVFNRTRILCSTVEGSKFNTSVLQFDCPRNFQFNDSNPYNANVTLSLCENTANFITLRLFFGGKWLLITEISFNSVPVDENEQTPLKHCSRDACVVTQSTKNSSLAISLTNSRVISLTTSPVISLTTSPTSVCEDCPRHITATGIPTETPVESSSDSSNLQLTIIIVCVIHLIVVILLVLVFLLYCKRTPCFGKMNKQKMANNNLHVELQNVENYEEPIYEESHLSESEGEIPVYEEVKFSSPSAVYAELSREQQDGIVDHKYQKLVKNCSGNNDTGDCETESYKDVEISSTSVYAELNRNTRDTTTDDDKTYQKLLENDSDYVIPAEDHVESLYEETEKTKSLPVNKELLDNTKREDNDAVYQNLMKE